MMTPLEAMKLAIAEGEKGIGHVSPNPAVGCVILDKNGDLLATGYHRFFGGEHAEIEALNKINDMSQIEGATFYVTLEPCAHVGKRPSCARRLATLPIAEVVYGLVDPNPMVRGKGLQMLESGGVKTTRFDRLSEELENLPEVFLWNQRQKKTFVAVKVATTLDGHIAHVSGDSQWLTGAQAQEHVHYLRAAYDAILVGKETFLKDNPSLNIRHPGFQGKENVAVVLDSKGEGLQRLKDSNIRKTHKPEKIFWFCAQGARVEGRPEAEIIRVPATKNGLDLQAVLDELYRRKIYSLFVEGGGQVISSFLKKNLVNRLYQFIAPQILGAKSGLSFTRDFSVDSFPERKELKSPKVSTFGNDVMITGRLL